MNSAINFRTFFLTCLLGCSLLMGCQSQDDKTQPNPSVIATKVSKERITLTRELPGRVSAFTVSEVRPQVGGIILKRLFEEGADVTAGQILYQIDPSLYEAAANYAEASLAREEANLVSARLLAKRYNSLVKADAVSKQERDNAVAALGQSSASVSAAKATLDTARINLTYTKVTAPVSGKIGRSFVTPGALVTQNQPTPLAIIQQLSPVYVDVNQSNTELLQLKRALMAGHLHSSDIHSAKVKLMLEDGSAYVKESQQTTKDQEPEWIEGDLQFSDVTINQSTGMLTIRAIFENPDRTLLPGMYVRAILEEGVQENALLLPQKAIARDTRNRPIVYALVKENPVKEPDPKQKPRVLEADEYYVKSTSVTLDRDYHNRWLINSGIQEGDLIIVDGIQKIRPNQVVTVKIQESSTSQHSSQPLTSTLAQVESGR